LELHKDDDQMAETTAPEPIIAPVPTFTPVPAVPPAHLPDGFSSNDLRRIVDAAKNNEMRFIRDYKGKPFAAKGTFGGASENFLMHGTFRIEVNTSGGTVDCHTSDNEILSPAANWTTGQQVIITGVIEDTVMGDLQLDDTCKVVAQ
jgi:hypothetical protein